MDPNVSRRRLGAGLGTADASACTARHTSDYVISKFVRCYPWIRSFALSTVNRKIRRFTIVSFGLIRVLTSRWLLLANISPDRQSR
jgi:hypothetical protein